MQTPPEMVPRRLHKTERIRRFGKSTYRPTICRLPFGGTLGKMLLIGGAHVNGTIDRLLAEIGNLESEIARDEERIMARRRLIGELRETIKRYEAAIGDTPAIAGRMTSPANGPIYPRHGETPNDSGELFGKSIVEAAQVVLGDVGGFKDYHEVAQMALERGYRSPKSGDDTDKVTRSFYEIMRKKTDVFEQHPTFRRRFCLKTERRATERLRMSGPEKLPVVGRKTGSDQRPRHELIREILADAGEEGMHISKIIDLLREKGDGVGVEQHAQWRNVDSTLRRGEEKGRFRKVGPATWTLGEGANGEA